MWEIFTSGFIPYPGLQNNDVMTFVKKGGRLEVPALCPQSMQVFELYFSTKHIYCMVI